MTPLVSVIVPNYNHAPYLAQRIDSILAQTWKDFELIILDDLSTDDSRSVIETYRTHSQVTHIICNTVNSGTTFKQWEKGISLAKGDFIWIAESDDWCEPTLLESLMEGLIANPGTGVAFCQSCMVVEPNTVKEISFSPYYRKTLNGTDFIRQSMLYSNSILNASMAVWRKSLFKDVDPAYKSFRFSGDWLFWISLLQKSDVYISGKVLNYFRKHDNDVSSGIYRSGKNYLEDLRLYEILLTREVIDNKDLVNLAKARYIGYLRDDKIHDPGDEAGRAIRRAYAAHIPVNRLMDPYYRLKGLVRHVKIRLNKP